MIDCQPDSGPASRSARVADRAGSAVPPSSRRGLYFGRRIWLGLQEIPRATRRASSRMHTDSWAERCLLSPQGKRVGRTAAGWIKARDGVPALKFAHDQLGIAIDVRADLQDRRFSVASEIGR